MDLFSLGFWSMVFSIVIIDLVLAGDNAIVIGMAACYLPKASQKKVILWGSLGAVIVRSLLTLAVVWLLKIPGLMLIGGLMLIWIAYKLLVQERKCGDMKLGASIWSAVKTIIIADAVMGLDNVLAVAGAAHGNFSLVIAGLLISVPIMMWGSTIILGWVERYPAVLYLGAGILAWTAANMITAESFLAPFFTNYSALRWAVSLAVIGGVLVAGRIRNAGTSLVRNNCDCP
jgi:integral membrane protein, YjbE family